LRLGHIGAYLICYLIASVTIVSNSSAIRVPKRDKERLERLAKKTGRKRLAEVFRFALSVAERETDRFRGNIDSLTQAHKFARSVGGNVSENIDESFAESLAEKS
jgi:hypothetical protein